MIIDMHCHLGDILYPGGGARILSGVPMAHPFDPDILRRWALYGFHALDSNLYSLKSVNELMSRAERKRNFTATLANLAAQLDRYGVSRAAVMPIAPNTLFEDLLPPSGKDSRLLPFGSFDFTQPGLTAQGKSQLARGAKGFKVHPILQRVQADGPEVAEALSALPDGTVILLHTGTSNYYPPSQSHLQKPEYGEIEGIAALCQAFPRLRFVAAHGGLRQFKALLTDLSPLANVWVDTSFVSPQGILTLMDAFGAKRVLFASDWPYGFYGTSIASVRAACRTRQRDLDAILGGNAAELLGL